MKYFAIWQFDEAYRRATDAIFSMLSRVSNMMAGVSGLTSICQTLHSFLQGLEENLGEAIMAQNATMGVGRTSVFNSGEEKAEVGLRRRPRHQNHSLGTVFLRGKEKSVTIVFKLRCNVCLESYFHQSYERIKGGRLGYGG